MKNKFKWVANTLANKVKDVDRYSRTISFTFKDKENFSTLLGGLISLVTYLILILYAYLILGMMFLRKDTAKNITTSISNLFNDSEPLQLNGTSFMFGLGLISSDRFYGLDDTYLSTSIRFRSEILKRKLFYSTNISEVFH